jgi:hypothetical protein
VSGRWRFYHDGMSDRHLAVVVRTSVPTGDFEEANRGRPGLQLGESYHAAVGAQWKRRF